MQAAVGDQGGDPGLGPCVVSGQEHVHRQAAGDPATSADANVVLNALTTWARGFASAISSAADIPGLVSSESKVEKSTGLQVLHHGDLRQRGPLLPDDRATLRVGDREYHHVAPRDRLGDAGDHHKW